VTTEAGMESGVFPQGLSRWSTIYIMQTTSHVTSVGAVSVSVDDVAQLNRRANLYWVSDMDLGTISRQGELTARERQEIEPA
jgi:hypothetical protein